MQKILEHLFCRTSANGCFWKCSWNWEKLEIVDKGLQLYIKKVLSASISEASEIVYLIFYISWLISFGVCIYINISLMLWEINSKHKQETLRVVTVGIICSTLSLFWKFQYFWGLIYNSVEYLWWSFHCKNSLVSRSVYLQKALS